MPSSASPSSAMRSLQLLHLPARACKTTRWSGGSTTELFLLGHSFRDRDFSLRVSRARIADAESTFTPLPGFARDLTLLSTSEDGRDGAGAFSLQIGGKPFAEVRPWKNVRFLGADAVRSRGVAEDFNVIWRPECVSECGVRVVDVALTDSRGCSGGVHLHDIAFSYPAAKDRVAFLHWPKVGRDQEGRADGSNGCLKRSLAVMIVDGRNTESRPCAIEAGDSVFFQSGGGAVALRIEAQGTPDLPAAEKSTASYGAPLKLLLVEFVPTGRCASIDDVFRIYANL